MIKEKPQRQTEYYSERRSDYIPFGDDTPASSGLGGYSSNFAKAHVEKNMRDIEKQ